MSDFMYRGKKRSLLTRGVVWFRINLKTTLGEHKWTILFLLGIIAFVFGLSGFGFLYKDQNESLLNLIYLTLQLFMLRSGLYSGSPIPLLDIARFLAPLLTFVSIIVVI